MLSVLTFSELHAAATTDAQRTIYLTAWEMLSQVSTATPQMLGFLLMAVAGLITSVVILQNRSFGRSAALGRAGGYVGIVGFVAAHANYASWILALAITEMLIARQWPVLARVVAPDGCRACPTSKGHTGRRARFHN
jgi:hypothetical protein